MSLDFHAIGTALAGKYDGLTPPTGERSIQYAGLPRNNLSTFPAVVVFPPEWEFAYQAQREGEMDWIVRFYRGSMSGDVNTDVTALLQWAGVLVDATHTGSKLGLSSVVKKAIPVSGEIGTHTYGGVEHGVVEITVRVFTNDTYSMTP